MAKRYYLCAMTGDGLSPATGFRPALADLISRMGGNWATAFEDSSTAATTVVLVVSDRAGAATGLHDECTRLAIYCGDTFVKAKGFIGNINAGIAPKLVDAAVAD